MTKVFLSALHVYSLDRWLTLSDEPGRRVVKLAMQQAQAAVEAAGQDGGLID